MEKTTNTSPNYLKGFNQGYQLAKEVPEFFMKDLPKTQNKPRIEGIVDGMRQYHHERYISKQKSKTPKPSQNKAPDKGISRN
jgi:hypothetical protein